MSCWRVSVSGLVLLTSLCLGTGQEVVNVSEMECVNGELVDLDNGSAGSCQCDPGWSGKHCAQCRGRVRLTNSSGIISEDLRNMNYSGDMNCLFYIEASQSVRAIHVTLHLLHLECQWDYLTIFDGDSISTQKIAAYTGNLLEQQNTTTSEPTLVPLPTVSSSGPNLLLYFYSDAAIEEAGFELAYWLDYECPNFCSERGVCNSSTGVCSCDLEWTGAACDVAICPDNCTENGVCDTGLGTCVCNQGYRGENCSVDELSAHWSISRPSSTIPLSTLARASHSAVIWRDAMLVYGGYRFPSQGYSYYDTEDRGEESERDLLRYSLESDSWEVLNTSATTYSVEFAEEGSGSGVGNESVRVPRLPAPRYGHSAVIYSDSMYIFGGALTPSEAVVSELWQLNLGSLQWTPLFNISEDNSSAESANMLPVAVRGHTAHVVGSKMVVLFGISSGENIFPAYVQEYDFVSGVWSLVARDNTTIPGRIGHSSVYSEETELIYIHGGRSLTFRPQLFSYDPFCHVWTSLTPSASVRYLHSSFLLGPLLVSFAGCQGHASDVDCFSRDLLLYNTLCDTWEEVELPGLQANASRYGHSSLLDPRDGSAIVFGGFVGTLRSDILRLVAGNCSQWREMADCVNASSMLCAWRSGEDLCVSVGTIQAGGENVTFPGCSVAQQSSGSLGGRGGSCPPSPPTIPCGNFTSCQDCMLYGCYWGISSNRTQPQCFSEDAFEDPVLNVTEIGTCTAESCYARTTCDTCNSGSSCLWCPSLGRCVPSTLYGVSFNFGQCLGWTTSCVQIECQEMTNCSSCQELPQCGWCNDPSDTGLGVCSLGGFGGPRNTTTCQGADSFGFEEEWQFDQCSACQCNGHSSCVNGSAVCEQCMNNTAGGNCQSCSTGYFGTAANGGSCAECDCNGYDLACDVVSGMCQCHALGVIGDRCTNCSGDYNTGDADNFCYSDLEVGFIYTYSVSSSNEVQGFYAVTPRNDESLHFNFDMRVNPSDIPVFAQLFLGRKSENLWVLVNLTEVLVISPRGSLDRNYDGFTSNDNESDPMLTSFTHPSIRNSENFSEIFNAVLGNDYTGHMWDGDVTLVLHLSNLNNPSTFRITVDQQNYIYLLYFFATFITCFSILLAAFLLVWYIKKKLVLRAYMRQQYIELQRRVARPFTKVMLAVDNTPVSTTPLPTEQDPSYLGVEACRDDKAAVLSLLVQLPGDHDTGRPSIGRTGMCIGSTLVYINSSKKPKPKKKVSNGTTPGRRGGGAGRRREGQTTTTRGGEGNSFLVHTGRARQRNTSDSHPSV